MPLTPTEAADVARRHGLTLQDAAGLLSLADDATEADAIAARFAAPDVDTAARELTRRLFGEREPEDSSRSADDFANWLGTQLRSPHADPSQTEEAPPAPGPAPAAPEPAPAALFSAFINAALTGGYPETETPTTDGSETP